jgi:DeoR family suf operon transcriptional repressor
MSDEIASNDVGLLDLLRKRDAMTVSELAAAMEVTATAVRQRLNRLTGMGYIKRSSQHGGRGRPHHEYSLTERGRRKTGSNFADLAVALWNEIREIKDDHVRQGLMSRISQKMAGIYQTDVHGTDLESRMESLAEIFGERQVPISVEIKDGMPVLTVLACPYPELAAHDRSVCSMERQMFTELLGEDVHLDECRLDGQTRCTFGAESHTLGRLSGPSATA